MAASVSVPESGWPQRSPNKLVPHLHNLAWHERSEQNHNGCHQLAAASDWLYWAGCLAALSVRLWVMTVVVLMPVAAVVLLATAVVPSTEDGRAVFQSGLLTPGQML